MSILSTNKLTSSDIETQIRIRENITLKHVRPHLEIHGVLTSGDIVLSIKDDGVILKEVSINYQDINSELTEPYAHGFFRFDFDGLVLNHNFDNDFTEYTIGIRIDNYTIDNNVFVSLIADMNIPVYGIHDSVSELANGYQFYTI